MLLTAAQRVWLIEETGIEALGSPFIPEHLSDDARGCIDIIKQSMPSNVWILRVGYNITLLSCAARL